MIKIAKEFKKFDKSRLEEIANEFDNKKNIQTTLDLIIEYLEKQKEKVFEILKM